MARPGECLRVLDEDREWPGARDQRGDAEGQQHAENADRDWQDRGDHRPESRQEQEQSDWKGPTLGGAHVLVGSLPNVQIQRDLARPEQLDFRMAPGDTVVIGAVELEWDPDAFDLEGARG